MHFIFLFPRFFNRIYLPHGKPGARRAAGGRDPSRRHNKMKDAMRGCILCYLLSILLRLALPDGYAYLYSTLPAVLAAVFIFCAARERRGKEEARQAGNPRDIARLTALAMPTVLVLAVSLSMLTTLMFGEGGGSYEGSVFWLIIIHALLPAVAEEILFRLLPMSLFPGGHNLSLILFSSLSFAVMHNDPRRIPHAFVAGIIFMAVDIAAHSAIPSFILHLANNLLAVIMIKVGAGAEMYVLAVLVVLTLITLPRLLHEEEILTLVRESDSGWQLLRSPEMIIFCVSAIAATIASLFI